MRLQSPLPRTLLAVGALAAATLLLEGTLLRLLAVGQFYHFAFLVVSLALLGFGASGTLLVLSRRLRAMAVEDLLAYAGIGFALSTLLAYLVANYLPFDSYSIAWERIQVLYFVIYYASLSLPFLCSGLGIGAALAAGGSSHLVYAANLIGSGVGALLALAALWLAGAPGALIIAIILGLLPAQRRPPLKSGPAQASPILAAVAIVAGLLTFGVLSSMNLQGQGLLGLTVSPYKGLSYARQYPGSRTIYGRWNAFSRVDVVADAGTRQLPGLSYTYPGNPPPQLGLALDAGSIQPITLVEPGAFEAAAFMPEALAFALRPNARVLVLEPGAGLGVLQSLAGGAESVTAVVGNPLAHAAVGATAGEYAIYANPRVRTVLETGRVYTQRAAERYDLVFLPLTDAYRPVTSGAYSLAETYELTVEDFASALARLEPGGLLVVSRWLQTPPSESIRLIATLVEALERLGIEEPAQTLVAYRGVQTITVLVQPQGWSAAELAAVRSFSEERRYDLVWTPGIAPELVNRFNRLPAPLDYEAVQALFAAPNRRMFYAAYPFAIAPPTDDHPFFFHFFTWTQTPQVLAAMGRTWQPFGGSGYFVLLALLALALLLGGGLILAPLFFMRRNAAAASVGRSVKWSAFLYFALLGVAFLFVEIPLIQRWILLLGHPAYAFTAVVLTLLLFSGVGSALARSSWLPRRAAMALLVVLALLTPWLIERLAAGALGFPFWLRAATAILSLAPLGLLMGLPFPWGLAWLEETAPQLLPWAWAINGCASVVTSVLAAILALSYGFTLVLWLGAGAYAGAWLVLFGGGITQRSHAPSERAA